MMSNEIFRTKEEAIDALRRAGYSGEIIIDESNDAIEILSSENPAKMATLKKLERLTLERVAALGRHEKCLAKCRMAGKQCPEIWCELHYHNIKKEIFFNG